MVPDPSLRGLVLVALGAALGGVLRYGVGLALPGAFPWATAAVNVVGSFLVGLLVFGGLVAAPEARLALVVGFLGAFTTMSAFAYDTLVLAEAGAWGRAALNVVANPLAALAAVALGRAAALAL